jgi:hypothetical protein
LVSSEQHEQDDIAEVGFPSFLTYCDEIIFYFFLRSSGYGMGFTQPCIIEELLERKASGSQLTSVASYS